MSDKAFIFQDWVALYGDDLYNWAYVKTSSKELSEDLVQETFISGFKSFDKFENRSKPKTWLITILNNKIIDHFRKSSKVSYLSIEKNGEIFSDKMFDEENFWINNLDDTIWSKSKSENSSFVELKLKECLNNLPEKWNLAISYKYFSEKETKEICQELEVSMSNYWQIIHRAKLLLKKCIEI